MLEDNVTTMRAQPMATVGPSETVEQVMKQMAELSIACVLVAQDDKLLGLFSERDVLNRVADRFEQVKDLPITELMTAEPVVVHETDSPASALNLMSVHGVRHVPILSVDDKLVGVVGPRRISEYLSARL